MNKFKKVSYEEYARAIGEDTNDLFREHSDIKLPKRATTKSAGYDFFSPCSFDLEVGEVIKLPTGIKVQLDDDKVLKIYPRSSLGFKYMLQLVNTVGIVDADFFNNPDNEGHIMIKMINTGLDGKVLHINKGDAIAQGIIERYFLTDDDDTDMKTIRVGGIGSSDKASNLSTISYTPHEWEWNGD